MPSYLFRRAVAFTATTAAVCALALTSSTAASAALVPDYFSDSAPNAALALTPLGTHEAGVYAESAAEIVQAYRDRLFVVNAQAGTVVVLDNTDPEHPAELFSIASTGVANSLAVRDDGLGVVAFEAETKTDKGHLLFFDANEDSAEAAVLGEVEVGALPDMVTVSKDGKYAVVANEGEPADDFSLDPEGSVSVVTLPAGVAAPAQSAVKTAGFGAFEAGGAKTLAPEVRVFGPDVAAPDQGDKPLTANRVSRNLEPEYITVDGTTAYAALQEANAIAVIDLTKPEVTSILPLGYKDYGTPGNGLDASDRDPQGAPTVNIKTYPGLKGLYMPDGIQSFQATVGGKTATYLVTANEGDAREWGVEGTDSYFIDEARVKDLGKDGLAGICATGPLSEIANIQKDDVLGRLKVVTDLGKAEGADCYSELYAYGGRSFSIWDTTGDLVFDSGDDFEQITSQIPGLVFNASNDNNTSNDRSDDKGPEPENVTIGVVGGKTYAFVGLERVGGVMVYDITDPAAAQFVTYVNNRDYTQDVKTAAAGDLGPEGIQFISALRSSTGTPQLVVGSEVSGTTTVWDVEQLTASQPDVRVLTINDFHGRLVQETGGVAGAAVLAGAVDKYRQQNPNTLFVSAGDNIGASAFESFIDDDDPTIDALVAAGLDASAVGNHEFDQGFDDLVNDVIPSFESDEHADAMSDFALGANVFMKGTDEHALQPYTIKTVNGTKIAFVGVVTTQTAGMVSPDGIAGIEFRDLVDSANDAAADAVAEGADVVILLAHEGAASSAIEASQSGDAFGDLVENASDDIDAIVSAHTHQRYAHEIGGRPVIQAHQYGTALGTLDIELTETGELESITGGTVSLYDSVVSQHVAYPQTETTSIVDDAAKVANEKGQVQVGSITADILRGKTSTGSEDRGAHSTLGNTVADVYLWATSTNPGYGGQDAQIAFMNPGGLRNDLLFGDDNGAMSYREVANVQPFGNTLVTLDLTGAQIKEILEQQWQPDGASRPKLALGVSKGFTFEYDPAAARGAHVVSMQYQGDEVDPTDTFRVVTNSFLSAGGDNFFSFADGENVLDSGQIDLQATVDFFAAAGGPVAPSPANRAYLIGEHPPVEGTDPGTDPGTGPGTDPGTTPPTPVNPGGNPPAAGVQRGGDWAQVDVGSGRVERGGTLRVALSGLEPNQTVAATLFSDPVVVSGIPAADAQGRLSFAVAIPSDIALGDHRLVITSAGLDPIEVGVTVVAPGALAATGSEFPWGIAAGGAALLMVAGSALFVIRKRRDSTAG
ncbi:choice-of-anchor I family protein [Microbacterium trichothecenolyticum]|uniref:Endonuclease YhcR n=1 Tax=Microbacterium trichothecenolyticum TaxID=69370 RepID=A0A0M2HC56_MICTR|nr:choice-of-anchor I family protein [Microbacterium trichothecenolyticum]KJL41782.1 Endonuclease YhcR precursor [Microbacterium trichothecenolyticum]